MPADLSQKTLPPSPIFPTRHRAGFPVTLLHLELFPRGVHTLCTHSFLSPKSQNTLIPDDPPPLVIAIIVSLHALIIQLYFLMSTA
jgi:hypothetical protein